MGTMNLVAPLAATLLASANRPLADPLLSYLDKLLFFGFDRRVMAAGMAEWPPVVMEWTRLIYHSIGPQSLIAIAALFFLRQERRAWTFATAWMLALMTCVALSPLFPALGTPPYSLDFIGAFEGARNGTLRTLGVQSLTGIVTFPSFHAAGAVLLGWGFWSIRAAAPFFVPLNVLMFASALFVGGHYLIDLFAGAAVAAASLFVSSKFIGAFAPATPAKAGSRAFNLRRPPARPAR